MKNDADIFREDWEALKAALADMEKLLQREFRGVVGRVFLFSDKEEETYLLFNKRVLIQVTAGSVNRRMSTWTLVTPALQLAAAARLERLYEELVQARGTKQSEIRTVVAAVRTLIASIQGNQANTGEEPRKGTAE